MILRKLKNIAIIALSSFAVIPAFGQDLLANQAPIDRKMNAVDAAMLKQLVDYEEYDSPADELYEDWDNTYAHRQTALPDSFRIDLRDFYMPTPSRVITSNFGSRWGRQHKGLDIKVYIGDTIRAAFDGKVRICKYNGGGYGYYIVIRHPNGLETLYGHLSKQIVKKDQIVRAGEPIGLGGNTGKSSGSHLHFETRVLGQPINPALMFDFVNQDVTGDFFVLQNGFSKGNIAAATRNTTRAEAPMVSASTHTTSVGPKQPTISKPQAKAEEDDKPVSYSVKTGDTLFSIAQKHGTTVEKLRQLNGLKANTILKTGQVIRCS